jgi:hypothetical protein
VPGGVALSFFFFCRQRTPFRHPRTHTIDCKGSYIKSLVLAACFPLSGTQAAHKHFFFRSKIQQRSFSTG